MRILQTIKKWHVFVGIAFLLAVFLVLGSISKDEHSLVATAIVADGTVRESVSVSGYIEAKNTAELSFPSLGIVTDVMVHEGQSVKKGDVLATLGSRALVAKRNEAVAALTRAQSAYAELLAGPSDASRTETAQTLSAAEVAYTQTLVIEEEKVAAARTALRSNDLTAYAENPDTDVTAPTISGSYTCEEEGVYTIEVYSSGAFSGYSYTLSGLESGNDAAYTQQTAPLGDCGLTIQFSEDERYAYTTWTIPVPNTNSATYVTYKNAYDLALETKKTNLAQAAATLQVAEATASRINADPTSYETSQSQSSISGAQAAVAAIDAQIADQSIIAPFDGTITDVDILPGETAGTAPIITLLAEDAFTLTARVPEIDITKVANNLPAEVVFDAKSDVILTGRVTFVSPLATEIDGVAYFETTITLDENPLWIRSGLNADIDIITQEVSGGPILPKRFILEDESGSYVHLLTNNEAQKKPITVLFSGNDGYAAITGLSTGDTVSVPEDY